MLDVRLFQIKIGDLVAGKLGAEEGARVFPNPVNNSSCIIDELHPPRPSISSKNTHAQHREEVIPPQVPQLKVPELRRQEGLDIPRIGGQDLPAPESPAGEGVGLLLRVDGGELVGHAAVAVGLVEAQDHVDAQREELVLRATARNGGFAAELAGAADMVERDDEGADEREEEGGGGEEEGEEGEVQHVEIQIEVFRIWKINHMGIAI